MADGTISFSEGLGSKAQDSNELRRKQKNPTHHGDGSVHIEQTPLSSSPKSTETSDPQINLGVHSPKNIKTSPARKLQQVFQNERRQLESEARMLEIVGHLEDELNNSADPFILDVVTAKLQSIQQSWKEDLQKEEDERPARLTSTAFSTEVGAQSPKSSPKSKTNSNPSPKLQQALFEDGLVREAEVRAAVQSQGQPHEVMSQRGRLPKLPLAVFIHHFQECRTSIRVSTHRKVQ